MSVCVLNVCCLLLTAHTPLQIYHKILHFHSFNFLSLSPSPTKYTCTVHVCWCGVLASFPNKPTTTSIVSYVSVSMGSSMGMRRLVATIWRIHDAIRNPRQEWRTLYLSCVKFHNYLFNFDFTLCHLQWTSKKNENCFITTYRWLMYCCPLHALICPFSITHAQCAWEKPWFLFIFFFNFENSSHSIVCGINCEARAPPLPHLYPFVSLLNENNNASNNNKTILYQSHTNKINRKTK